MSTVSVFTKCYQLLVMITISSTDSSANPLTVIVSQLRKHAETISVNLVIVLVTIL